MKKRSLKNTILYSILAVIAVTGILIILLGYFIINNVVIDNAQLKAKNDLAIAKSFYQTQISDIERAFTLSSDYSKIKKIMKLDYIYVINNKNQTKSEIAQKAFEGKPVSGTRIISKEELGALAKNLAIQIKETPKAHKSNISVLDSAMAKEVAIPISKNKVVYGGKIINKDFSLIDKIHNFVFENKLYNGKPIGTVTIFQGDVRIATNVLDDNGQRAIGTRVSDTVYNNVLIKGKTWVNKAFVVTDWYLTAYEPIKNINGKTIGILYVGILEKPLLDARRNILISFLVVIILAGIASIVLSYFIAGSISRPITHLIEGTQVIFNGDLKYRIKKDPSSKELNELATSFNKMAEKLDEREVALSALNRRYLDLIGFVSHELKGILSSTLLHAYSVRDGYLGIINFKQRRALDAVARNLDYFDSTIKNFLNLSRIEKGEMTLNKSEILLKEDIFDRSIEEYVKPASEKQITISNNIEPNIKIVADPTLLQIVANNLIQNAVKYGVVGGKIILSSKVSEKEVQIEVYNDGTPLSKEEQDKLFKRFSRLSNQESKKEKGTGLGLFITSDIIVKHNGKIWVEPKDQGNSFLISIERGI